MTKKNNIGINFLRLIVLVNVSIIFSQNSFSTNETDTLFSIKDSIESNDWSDGPHIEWLDDHRINLVYFNYSARKDRIKRKSIYSEIRKDEKLIHGKFGDKKSYYVARNHKPSNYEYSGVGDLVVIGDVHGEYDALTNLLKKAEIVDENLNWRFGNGHLIFLGDIFDKGKKVTESLWLIKNLSYQAEHSGGKVHIIMGNHEIMNLSNNYLYNADKYVRLSNDFSIEYRGLYNKNNELGRWIRTWSCVLKIDDKLFVHGGISPLFNETGIGIMELNSLTKNYLEHNLQHADSAKLEFLLGSMGPYMYRGYVMQTEEYNLITEEEVDEILNALNVEQIIFGHTEIKYFHLLYNNKLMAIDVPLRFSGKSEQALYFTGDEIYKIYNDGSRVKLR